MLGRRPVYMEFEELKELLGLPEEVNIYNVKTNQYGALEFEIVSPEPIEGLTYSHPQTETAIRRIGVKGIKAWKEEQNK